MKECVNKQQAKATIEMVVVTLKIASIMEEQSALALFLIRDNQMPNGEMCEYL